MAIIGVNEIDCMPAHNCAGLLPGFAQHGRRRVPDQPVRIRQDDGDGSVLEERAMARLIRRVRTWGKPEQPACVGQVGLQAAG
ncbi:MAG TPA: hypothetical protein VFZ89_00375 [Solirubrobacteraceae bacterium]